MVNSATGRAQRPDLWVKRAVRHPLQIPLRLMHKDMHLMMDAARENGVKLPGLEKIDEIYEEASRAGHDDLDYAATIMLLEEWAGIGKPA